MYNIVQQCVFQYSRCSECSTWSTSTLAFRFCDKSSLTQVDSVVVLRNVGETLILCTQIILALIWPAWHSIVLVFHTILKMDQFFVWYWLLWLWVGQCAEVPVHVWNKTAVFALFYVDLVLQACVVLAEDLLDAWEVLLFVWLFEELLEMLKCFVACHLRREDWLRCRKWYQKHDHERCELKRSVLESHSGYQWALERFSYNI